MFQHELV